MKKLVVLLALGVVATVALMAVFPEDATRAAFAIERLRSGVESRTASVDGETWHYLEGGSVDAPVVLLLHGFGGDKDNWTRFAKTLTDDYRVIAPDLPGFGESNRHYERDYSLSTQRDRIFAFAEVLGLERFHIGGNSMGGQIAALYAHHYPRQVLSLALLNNAGVESPNPSEVQLAVERGESPLTLSSPDDFDRLLNLVSHKIPFIPWPAKDVLAQRSFVDSTFNRHLFDTYKDDRSAGIQSLLPEIKLPVLILWGEHDRVLDVSSVDVMRPLLPQATIVIMEDTGHIPMIERPGETAKHYLDFMEGY